VAEMALRIGVSEQTLSHFERTGKANLLTFVRILEILNAAHDLQAVLQQSTNSIETMRAKAAQPMRQRAYSRSSSKTKPVSKAGKAS
jgi:DNA-binding XRE family transcriptional regulator